MIVESSIILSVGTTYDFEVYSEDSEVDSEEGSEEGSEDSETEEEDLVEDLFLVTSEVF